MLDPQLNFNNGSLIYQPTKNCTAMNTGTIAREHEGLLDIDEVESFNHERDQPIFNEIREVLSRHGALNRFGISLLHKHFDIYEGERLVEFCDEERRTLTLRPIRRELQENESFMETNWRFDVDSQFVNQRCWAECLKTGDKHHEIHPKRD